MSFYRLYQDSSPTPPEAVNDYITRITSESPQKIESLNIVSSTQSSQQGNEQLILFQADDRGLQTHIVGYATIKKSIFGWYVDDFQMTGRSPLPTDVLAGFDWSESRPIVYGQVFLADAASVKAVFSDPNQGDLTIATDIFRGNFAVFGTPYSELTMLKILDGNGMVLKKLTRDDLYDG
jgi:hypothetical protein